MRILVKRVRQSFRESLQSKGGVVGVCLGHGGRRACFIVSLSHCVIVSLSHCLTVSLSHCLIVSLSYAFAVLTPAIRFVLAYSSFPSASIITVIM